MTMWFPKLFQTSFSKDLIGSDKPTESQGKWVLTWLPRLIGFLIATHWEETFIKTLPLAKQTRGDREFLMLAMCSCCWIVGTRGITGHCCPNWCKIVLHLLLKDKKQKSGDKREYWQEGPLDSFVCFIFSSRNLMGRICFYVFK